MKPVAQMDEKLSNRAKTRYFSGNMCRRMTTVMTPIANPRISINSSVFQSLRARPSGTVGPLGVVGSVLELGRGRKTGAYTAMRKYRAIADGRQSYLPSNDN
jgi:hypothetical protein